MDGLTISNAEGLIETGQTLSELRANRIKSEVSDVTSGTPSKSFSETLKEAVNTVNEMQTVANTKMQDLATGKNKNIADVMIATEKAGIAMNLMVQVRNKIIDAYQEVMKMQV